MWNVQVATWTSNNRYPAVFRTVQARIAERFGADLGQARLKILSFGCSNGSELASLRCYFPEALLFGCDVNRGALHSASETLAMDEAVLFESSPGSIAAHGPFDVILAMSVLCRFPESMRQDVTDLAPFYPFRDFDHAAALLAANLRAGGLLCLYNSNYDFRRTRAAQNFRPLRSVLIASNGFVDKFNAEGQRLTWCEQRGPFYVHRPRGTGAADQADFIDCVFEKSGFGAAASVAIPDLSEEAVPDIAPALFRFGPDLAQCRQEGVVATAMGIWIEERRGEKRVLRAWHRTTPARGIDRGPCWAVRGDAGSEAALCAERPDWSGDAADGPRRGWKLARAAGRRLHAAMAPAVSFLAGRLTRDR